MTAALPAGQCQSQHVLDMLYSSPGIPIATEFQCSREGGHEGDHQYIRGSWVIVRWDNTSVTRTEVQE